MSEPHNEASFFEWDKEKAKTNLAKHHVSFEEARTAFTDRYARRSFDFNHSKDEARFQLLGETPVLGRVLRIWFTERGTKLRLIGARKASSRERDEYEQFKRHIL